MSSKNAKNTAARLAAVQALYQASQNKQGAAALVEEYLLHRNEIELEEGKTHKIDGKIFRQIIAGVYERSGALETLVSDIFHKENKVIEPLLKSILLCAAYELTAHQEIDSPIIINDYLNIAHSFYEAGEVKLINGILDKISKSIEV